KHLYEDIEVEATIRCAISTNHPDFSADGANIVASLDGSLVAGSVLSDDSSQTTDYRSSLSNDLDAFPHCWLFHDLYDHHNISWNRMLAIGQIWADVHLIQQRIVTWEV